jgi:hypothetical protein
MPFVPKLAAVRLGIATATGVVIRRMPKPAMLYTIAILGLAL